MIIMPIPVGTPHYEKSFGKFTYRYGYQEIKENTNYINACVEESRFRYAENVIKKKVQDYCESIGIPDEWNPADYGFED